LPVAIRSVFAKFCVPDAAKIDNGADCKLPVPSVYKKLLGETVVVLLRLLGYPPKSIFPFNFASNGVNKESSSLKLISLVFT
jgi:hypothetical protein